MSETKTYIIVYDEKKKLYRLVPPVGRAIRVKKDHMKFEWVQQQEAGKVVKINAAGRWTSSKDYDGLYEQIQTDSKPDNKAVANTKKAPKIEGGEDENDTKKPKKAKSLGEETENIESQKSVLGFHKVQLRVEVKMSRYVETNSVRESDDADELLLDVATFYTTVSFASTSIIQRKFIIGYNRATRIIDALEKLSIIKDHKPLVQSTAEVNQLLGTGNGGIDLGLDPKSSKWPITEKINCSKCRGKGKITSTRIESTGFLNLKKKEVQDVTECVLCNGVGYSEKLHYPYHLEELRECNYDIEVEYNLDIVVKDLLDEYISKNEFTRWDMLYFLSNNLTVELGANRKLCKEYSLTSGTAPKAGSVPAKATWQMIKEVSEEINQFSNFSVENAAGFIKLLFKLQIIDDGTKRRSTKDNSVYYKLTKEAKKLYASL